jgi:lysophospholipase L1-like esterase
MALNYSSDPTRFEKQSPIYSDVFMISYAHNQGGTSDYDVQYPAFIDQILTKYPIATVIPSTQNPQTLDGRTQAQVTRHEYLNNVIAKTASSKNLNLIDAFGAFVKADDNSTNIDPDGVHPTAAGSLLWSNTALRVLGFNS